MSPQELAIVTSLPLSGNDPAASERLVTTANRSQSTPQWPFISVLVPVRNEERCLERTLQGLWEQDYPRDRYEVIVADGQSSDGTLAIVRRWQQRWPQLHCVSNPRRWSSAGRNAALRVARGELVLIIDGHCYLPDRNYLRNLARAFAASGADCLARPQPLEVPDPTPFQEAVALARRSWLGHNPHSDIFADTPRFIAPDNTAVAYRRGVFERVGLFDETFDACEDVEFNTRVRAAGLRCYFAPELRVHYEPRRSVAALFHQLARYGTGRARLAFKHPHALTGPTLLPPLWLVWLLAGPAAAMLLARFCLPGAYLLGLAWLGSIITYGVVLVIMALLLGRGRTGAVRRRIPLAFVAIHLGFAWGFWREVLRQATNWAIQAIHKIWATCAIPLIRAIRMWRRYIQAEAAAGTAHPVAASGTAAINTAGTTPGATPAGAVAVAAAATAAPAAGRSHWNSSGMMISMVTKPNSNARPAA